MSMESYTQNLKKVIEARRAAEELLKRAIASIHYVEMSNIQHTKAKLCIERAKELIISGNIILKNVTDAEQIGAHYGEELDDACDLFEEATGFVNDVLKMIETLKG